MTCTPELLKHFLALSEGTLINFTTLLVFFECAVFLSPLYSVHKVLVR